MQKLKEVRAEGRKNERNTSELCTIYNTNDRDIVWVRLLGIVLYAINSNGEYFGQFASFFLAHFTNSCCRVRNTVCNISIRNAIFFPIGSVLLCVFELGTTNQFDL